MSTHTGQSIHVNEDTGAVSIVGARWSNDKGRRSGWARKFEQISRSVPSWEKLATVGEAKAVKSSYVFFVTVPVIAKLVLALKAAACSNDSLLCSFMTNFSLPFRLKVLYAASLMFTLAAIAYKFWAPQIVTKFDGYTDYSKNGKGSTFLVRALWYWTVHLNPKKSTRGRFGAFRFYLRTFAGLADETTRIDPGTRRLPLMAVNAEVPDEKLKDAFYYVRELHNQAKPGKRALTTGCFAVGGILLLWVAVDSARAVLFV